MTNEKLENQGGEHSPLVYTIPLEGSLGLLALGWQGLTRWREKRAEVEDVKPATDETDR